MDFEAVIKSRTATRKFKSVEVEDAKIEKILSAGRLAPTAKKFAATKNICYQI